MAPKPPEKGSFPLDHDGECKSVMQVYLQCLKNNRSMHNNCRGVSKAYLECRMERGLMLKEPLDQLGFVEGQERDDSVTTSEEARPPAEDPAAKKRAGGFVAGLNVKGAAFRKMGEGMARRPRPN